MITEKSVIKTLLDLGFEPHLKGFDLIKQAVIKCSEEPCIMESVTKMLYPYLAVKNADKPSRVERAIRNSIEMAFIKNSKMRNIFGNEKPVNSRLIAEMALRIEQGLI